MVGFLQIRINQPHLRIEMLQGNKGKRGNKKKFSREFCTKSVLLRICKYCK